MATYGLSIDYPPEEEICLDYGRSQSSSFHILLSRMKAGDATAVSEALDICFHFVHCEYSNTKCLVKKKSFQVVIQQGKNDEKKIA